MTFYVQAPIFVFREFMRHRIASYNEESGRYRELKPVFYVPDANRNLVQVGKPGAYDFLPGTPEQHEAVQRPCASSRPQRLRGLPARCSTAGVAREVARVVLPLNLYSSMYVTMNARSLMNFLSLRTKHRRRPVPSFPQREIELVAEAMEAQWATLMPHTHAAFRRTAASRREPIGRSAGRRAGGLRGSGRLPPSAGEPVRPGARRAGDAVHRRRRGRLAGRRAAHRLRRSPRAPTASSLPGRPARRAPSPTRRSCGSSRSRATSPAGRAKIIPAAARTRPRTRSSCTRSPRRPARTA